MHYESSHTLWRNTGTAQQLLFLIVEILCGVLCITAVAVSVLGQPTSGTLIGGAFLALGTSCVCVYAEYLRRGILRTVSLDADGVLTFATNTDTFRCHRDAVIHCGIWRSAGNLNAFRVVVAYEEQGRARKKRFTIAGDIIPVGAPENVKALDAALEGHIPVQLSPMGWIPR